MNVSKIAFTALSALTLMSMSAQAQNQGFGDNPNWPIGQGVNQGAQPVDRTMQSDEPNGSDDRMQGQHSKRRHQPPSGPSNRDKQYGYEKPKNPYNNGVNSPDRDFRRGERLPVEYRGNQGGRYAVVDWHDHPELYAPPAGMRWAYIDGRYILATIATGLIYNIIYGH